MLKQIKRRILQKLYDILKIPLSKNITRYIINPK